MPKQWTLTYSQKGWSLNEERRHKAHYWRAAKVKEWRAKFKELAEEAKIPALEAIRIEVFTTFATRRLQDPANNLPASKAAVDGLVDAGVIEDDVPRLLKSITFHAGTYDKGNDSVTLLVINCSNE